MKEKGQKQSGERERRQRRRRAKEDGKCGLYEQGFLHCSLLSHHPFGFLLSSSGE